MHKLKNYIFNYRYIVKNHLHYFSIFNMKENNVTLFNCENLYEMKIESPIMHASSRSDRQC